MADIFLSYDSEDRDRVRPLVEAFTRQGWTVWWDRRIPPGQSWHEVIQEALDTAKCVVVVWSQHSVKSDWVIVEAEEGKGRDVLIPLLLDDVKVPLSFRLIQAARLVDWQAATPHAEWDFLLDTIRAIIGASGKKALPQPRRTDEMRAQRQTPQHRNESSSATTRVATPADGSPGRAFLPFEFTVVTLDAQGSVTERRKEQARYFIEDLGGGVALEMVEIPGGTFLMGSPVTEAGHDQDESPQHQVTVPPFQMGKFEITQAQWRAVAGWPKVKLDLHPEPAHFKGEALPVEQVAWAEAMEFCARLARRTGKNYRLPSEAEWEYAARAGASTPFTFGATITPVLVNYDGNYPYAAAPPGLFRQMTLPVGQLEVANAFGLFDMHGNVCEWCQDVWHADYEGAPADGSAWLSGGKRDYRVLRGGSWSESGIYCRSANRYWSAPVVRYDTFGLRVVVDNAAVQRREQ